MQTSLYIKMQRWGITLVAPQLGGNGYFDIKKAMLEQQHKDYQLN